ncbi:Uracil DNA glycosylase superfamily protein [Altererythrobacter xiamenensis]|uniref:Uracil DNA glycosylase superfamily protein n=2 Tax=Altererythrobacter xiamenensis TaxID=1316679 RepID=A0A1Y6F7G9_9SPHN|nr:Uracil DNA glycosylase superfamily protein [Altererythrobacter xiamenensis]
MGLRAEAVCGAAEREAVSWDGVPLGIREELDALPADILSRSGKVFYVGAEALQKHSQIYLLGLNPGGDPDDRLGGSTIGQDLKAFRERKAPWSAYADESWRGRPPGTWGMQPRILHLLRGLEANLRFTPASNVVFVRSRRENDLEREKEDLLRACWPVHQAVIDSLRVRVVVCLGQTAGRWVREQLDAHQHVDWFKETNGRGWASHTHQGADGRQVVSVTHPSIANWCNPDADPTSLVVRAMKRANTG